ncbi:helix-turn-helix domain-containing protein [Zhihengliuella salsuginis]|uniref:Transcription regulator n=1 Tax=Zhihengliuella salsuginis TaxID=578222 RepID=A0ABQ3GLJ8_9MICC|nr:cupin domain-containing protein [Zhihengliuella salsuginis]GHD10466.1 transcription regulator [Zhihengliuella salsuginis]
MKALPVEPSSMPLAIGSRLRSARQTRRMTIEQLAASTGLTKGFLSRVERDLTSPSVASLVTICEVLSLSVGELFERPQTHLVRAGEGLGVSLGGQGIREQLLTARSERRVQVIRAEIEPHGVGEEEMYSVDCDVEVLHVESGEFVLKLSGGEFALSAGDTITFPGREPHTWVNPAAEPAVVHWTLVLSGRG